MNLRVKTHKSSYVLTCKSANDYYTRNNCLPSDIECVKETRWNSDWNWCRRWMMMEEHLWKRWGDEAVKKLMLEDEGRSRLDLKSKRSTAITVWKIITH